MGLTPWQARACPRYGMCKLGKWEKVKLSRKLHNECTHAWLAKYHARGYMSELIDHEHDKMHYYLHVETKSPGNRVRAFNITIDYMPEITEITEIERGES